ncbi:hypothetical protein HK405_012973 [Cladochytrium tenue]|nr:hypothetical protein HK405_012973 [Cladochytrium tenue]
MSATIEEVLSSSVTLSATLKVVAAQDVPGKEIILEKIQLTTSKASVVAKGQVLSFKFWIGDLLRRFQLKFASEAECDECAELVRRLSPAGLEALTADSQPMGYSQADSPIAAARDIASSMSTLALSQVEPPVFFARDTAGAIFESGGGGIQQSEQGAASASLAKRVRLDSPSKTPVTLQNVPTPPPAAVQLGLAAGPTGPSGTSSAVDARPADTDLTQSDTRGLAWFRALEPEQQDAAIDDILDDPNFLAYMRGVERDLLTKAGVPNFAGSATRFPNENWPV